MKRSFPFEVFALFVTTLPALSGCVMLGGDAADVTNTCSTSDDCHGGGVCADAFGTSACVATEASLPGLILEVRPTAEAGFGAATSFLLPFDGGGLVSQSTTGLVVEHDLGLSLVNVSPIELYVDYDYKNCPISADSKVAADITFFRDAGHAGLPEYEVTATQIDGAIDAYAADLPPGSYDIHVVPHAPEGCMAPAPPPTFRRSVDLSRGGKIDLHLLAAPRMISGTIGFPKGQDLTGWTMEVVEPKRGKRVSRAQVLSVEPLSLYASYSLEYYWEWGIEGSPILRLRPPEGVKAPKLFWEIVALSPLNPDDTNIQANLVLIDLDAVGRDVEAFVVDTKGNPVVAAVEITSRELSGNASSNAAYSVIVDTDLQGRFTTKLPPGRYQVTAHPTSDFTKAITSDEWEVLKAEPGCFCGSAITVHEKSVVSGSVELPSGLPLGSGAVSIYPSRDPARSYLSSRLVVDAPSSQIASSPLGPLGDFSLLTDPGLVDLLVVPPQSSFYPWLVRSQLDVRANVTGDEIFSQPHLPLPYPVVLGGVVRDPQGRIVTDATVRAWRPVKATASGNDGNVVIQVGEAFTGADGRYVLPLAPIAE